MKCLACNKDITNIKSFHGFTRYHLKPVHNMASKEYYDEFIKTGNDGKCKICGKDTKFICLTLKSGSAYLTYCSKKCSMHDPDKISKILKARGFKNRFIENKERSILISKSNIECKICNQKFINSQSLVNHIITTHKDITIQQYYNTHVNSEIPKCKICKEKNAKFFSLTKGYSKYCSQECSWKDKDTYRKILDTRILKGQCIHNCEKESFEWYSKIVRFETRKKVKQLFESWDGLDFYTKEKLILTKEFKQLYPNENKFQNKLLPTVDHKISVFEGFMKKLNPFDIAAIDNLVICSLKKNSSKQTKSLIVVEEEE